MEPVQRGMLKAWRRTVSQDWHANPRDPKARCVLIGLRTSQLVMASRCVPPFFKFVIEIGYRFVTEWILGIELRPKTVVGDGLRIYHGTGLVVNDHTILGRNVILRHGVTLGHVRAGEGCPVVEDDVEFGAGAIAIGPIRIGTGAVIGAGAVVSRDVPPHAVVTGNPGRVKSINDDGDA